MNTPIDYENPQWTTYQKIHCWRNHVPTQIQAIWMTFNQMQKASISQAFQEMADNEEWD